MLNYSNPGSLSSSLTNCSSVPTHLEIGEVALSTRRQPTSTERHNTLPTPPTDLEKYSYAKRALGLHVTTSALGGIGILAILLRIALGSPWLWVFLIPFAFSVAHRLAWIPTVLLSRDFDSNKHVELVQEWAPGEYPVIDVFLPVCGEPLNVLENTWHYVSQLEYPGQIMVFCLDDSGSDEVRLMAEAFDFVYLSRPNRGWHKKAGNLRYGYERSEGDFIVVFDADFCPRSDFLTELLPYFDAEPNLGIVQSPQYFRVKANQNWVERGAGAVQEPFYRVLQTSRQRFDGAICVGTNAIYRRRALDDNGGNALVDYSEDVHTGIELRRIGWGLRYVPIVLATGLCPDQLPAFFVQQYRWSRGSMGLRCSRKFWSIKMPVRSRLSYISGPMFYVHQVTIALLTPVLLTFAMLATPEVFNATSYALMAPFVLGWIIMLPRRNDKIKADAASVKLLSSWASLFAIYDLARGQAMAWQPSGGKVNRDRRFHLARRGVMWWNGGWGAVLMLVAGWLSWFRMSLAFVPVLGLGFAWCLAATRIVSTATGSEVAIQSLPVTIPAPRSPEQEVASESAA